jgi:hypothetical protein
MARALRLFVGRQNIRASEDSAAAALGQDLRASLNGAISNLTAFVNHVQGVTPEILVEALTPTFHKALEWCPVGETGRLKESGYLEVESFRGSSVAVMGFGRGGNPDYTVYVHEIPATHAAPTRSKWFQGALDEDYFKIIDTVPQLVAASVGL